MGGGGGSRRQTHVRNTTAVEEKGELTHVRNTTTVEEKEQPKLKTDKEIVNVRENEEMKKLCFHLLPGWRSSKRQSPAHPPWQQQKPVLSFLSCFLPAALGSSRKLSPFISFMSLARPPLLVCRMTRRQTEVCF